MKALTILYFANLALAANSYYIVRRGVPSRTGFSSGGDTPLRAKVNAKTIPLRRVAAKSADTGGGAPKSGVDPPKRSASVSGKGPAELYYVDEHGNNISRYVSKGDAASRKSTHPIRPQAGGLLKGSPSGDEPLKVKAEGEYAGVIVSTPPGGSGHFKVTGDGTVQEGKTEPGENIQALAHIKSGGAKAEATVSRPGKAFAISYDSPANLKVPGEIFEAPKEEKP